MMIKFPLKSLALASSLLLSSCSWLHVYKLDVQQGNIITSEMLRAIKPGMSKAQVQFIMGAPVLENPFGTDRSDYVYYYKPGYGKTSTRQVTLFFKGSTLERIVGPIETGPQDSPPQKTADLSDSLSTTQPWQQPWTGKNPKQTLPTPFD